MPDPHRGPGPTTPASSRSTGGAMLLVLLVLFIVTLVALKELP